MIYPLELAKSSDGKYPVFCSHCGAVLVGRTVIGTGFDSFTGRQPSSTWLVCPNYRQPIEYGDTRDWFDRYMYRYDQHMAYFPGKGLTPYRPVLTHE